MNRHLLLWIINLPLPSPTKLDKSKYKHLRYKHVDNDGCAPTLYIYIHTHTIAGVHAHLFVCSCAYMHRTYAHTYACTYAQKQKTCLHKDPPVDPSESWVNDTGKHLTSVHTHTHTYTHTHSWQKALKPSEQAYTKSSPTALQSEHHDNPLTMYTNIKLNCCPRPLILRKENLAC